MQQIIAMGGGGFSMEPDNLALDRYIIEQAGKERPRVCFLPQAGGERDDYVLRFVHAFTSLGCRPTWLSLFSPHTADIEDFLMAQDVIYVGGGNTKSMLALWREWGLDVILRKTMENGTVLAGISAGANCWFEYCTTDSIPGELRALACLGYLKGSVSPHYDGEERRRPTFHRLIGSGAIPNGIALDDGAAAHYVDGVLRDVVSSRIGARAYWVQQERGAAREETARTRYLFEKDLIQKLVTQIEETFADTPYPGESGWREEIKIPVGVHWRDLPFEVIFRQRGELPFLMPSGWRFYLPAFMRATLQQYDEVDTLSENLIGLLSPRERNDEAFQRFVRKNSNFSFKERQAILAFLESYTQLNRYEAYGENLIDRPLLDAAIEYWRK